MLTEAGFYAYILVNQVRHGYPPFMRVQERDPILFAVFAIGYINLLAGAAFIAYLSRHRRALLAREPSPAARPA